MFIVVRNLKTTSSKTVSIPKIYLTLTLSGLSTEEGRYYKTWKNKVQG